MSRSLFSVAIANQRQPDRRADLREKHEQGGLGAHRIT